MSFTAGNQTKITGLTGLPPSALAARTGARDLDELLMQPNGLSMALDTLVLSPATHKAPEGASAAAAPAEQPPEPVSAPAATAATRPRRRRDVAEIPDEVRTRHPQLEPAMGKTLRVEDYHVELIQGHVEDLALVPESVLAAVRKRGLRDVHIANRAVPDLDSNQKLRDEQPRGWDDGANWNDVPGAYNPNNRSVVAGAGGHGSLSLMLHEYGHAVGDLLKFDDHREVKAAHERLFDKLPPYQRQDGPGGFAGRQEMFAEAFALYLKEGEEAMAKQFDQPFADFMRDVVLKSKP